MSDRAAYWDNKRFWILHQATITNAASPTMTMVAPRRDLNAFHLLCYSEGSANPVTLPLRLKRPPAGFKQLAENPQTPFESTMTDSAIFAPGIVLTKREIPGFWLFSWADINVQLSSAGTAVGTGPAHLRSEIENRVSALVSKYDTNKNGLLDPFEAVEIAGNPFAMIALWPQIDERKKGFIDFDELARFDFDGNGKATESKVAALHHAMFLIVELTLNDFDANADGVLNLDELRRAGPRIGTMPGRFPGEDEAIFKRLDLNKDGVLDRAELVNQIETQVKGKIRALTLNSKVFDSAMNQVLAYDLEAAWERIKSMKNRNRPIQQESKP